MTKKIKKKTAKELQSPAGVANISPLPLREDMGRGTPSVFTPSNEPYLGIKSILWFDRVIVWALDGNRRVADYTHDHMSELSELQHAACQIIPQGVNIALSIRELIRQAYLFPAQVLMRPLIERAAIISYLCLHPNAVALWHSGWQYSKRPKLAEMMHAMSGTKDYSELVVNPLKADVL